MPRNVFAFGHCAFLGLCLSRWNPSSPQLFQIHIFSVKVTPWLRVRVKRNASTMSKGWQQADSRLLDTDVFYFIERFYNPRRRHSTLGQVSPDQFERATATLGECP